MILVSVSWRFPGAQRIASAVRRSPSVETIHRIDEGAYSALRFVLVSKTSVSWVAKVRFTGSYWFMRFYRNVVGSQKERLSLYGTILHYQVQGKREQMILGDGPFTIPREGGFPRISVVLPHVGFLPEILVCDGWSFSRLSRCQPIATYSRYFVARGVVKLLKMKESR